MTGCVSAIVGLAALIALAEVGLRISDLVCSPPAAVTATHPLVVDSWTTGWQLRPQSRTSRGVLPEVRTNGWGLRGPELVVPKPAGVFRIALLGDSAVLGLEHADEDLVTAQFQATLQAGTNYAIEVVNAALPTGGPLLLTIHLQRTVLALQPDLVIVQLDPRDWSEDVALRRWIVSDPQGRPLACLPPDSSPVRSTNQLQRWRSEFRLVDAGFSALGRSWSTFETNPSSTTLGGDNLAAELSALDVLHQLCQTASVQLAILVTPDVGPADAETWRTRCGSVPATQDLLNTLGPWIIARQAVGVDATSIFSKERTAPAGTWNVEEHRAVAEFLAKHCRERVPGPWSSPYLQQRAPVTPASHRAPQ